MNRLSKYQATRGSHFPTLSKKREVVSGPVQPPGRAGVASVSAALPRADGTHPAVGTVTPWPLPEVCPPSKEDTSSSLVFYFHQRHRVVPAICFSSLSFPC